MENKNKIKCDGRKYRCPYTKKCVGEFRHRSSEDIQDLTSPGHFWYIAKSNLTNTSKIWFGKKTVYICQPRVEYKNFYELETIELISRIKNNLLDFINELTGKIENIEKKLK